MNVLLIFIKANVSLKLLNFFSVQTPPRNPKDLLAFEGNCISQFCFSFSSLSCIWKA